MAAGTPEFLVRQQNCYIECKVPQKFDKARMKIKINRLNSGVIP